MNHTLPKPKTTKRTCLRCNKPFPSTGPGNRICPKCSAYQPGSARILKCLDHRSHP